MKRSVVQTPAAIGAIKECIAYRGSMDAVTGDQYNVEVREAAKECLDVVYSDAGEMSATSGGGGGQLQGGGMAGLGSNTSSGGYGSSSSSGGGYGGGYGAPMGGTPGSGMSSTATTAAGGGGGAPGSRMAGIGNPMFADPRLAQNEAGKLGQLGSMASNVGGAMLGMIKDPLAKSVENLPSGGVGGYNPNARPDPYAQPPPGRNNLAMQTGGQWTMASNRGPNAIGGPNNAAAAPTPAPASIQNSEYYKARNAQGSQGFSWAASGGGAPPAVVAAAPAGLSGVGGSWGSAPQPPSQPMSVAAQARQPPAPNNVASAVPGNAFNGSNSYGTTGGGGTGNGEYEKNLILELCPPGGMKAEPPTDKLEEFARAIPSLNPDLVCPALLDALEEGNPWIMRAKALCVIETVLNVEADSSGEIQAYTDFFHACVGEVEPLTNHARASVKGPAKRVLAALGVQGNGPVVGMNSSANIGFAVAPAAATPVVPPTNLLDFDEPAPAMVAAPADSPPVAPSTDMFSGLNTKAVSEPMCAPPVAAPPIAVQQQGDLFSGLSTSSVPTMIPQAASVASDSNDLFGNMAVKSTDAKVENGTSNGAAEPVGIAAASGPGSAFGFMNADAPATPAPPPVVAATPTSPSSKTFDPLLSMGMPGSNNSLTNTPISPNSNSNQSVSQMQQMQMAYQQNMLMMQQKMQQMQMQQQQHANFQRQGSSNSNNFGGGGMPPPIPMSTPTMTMPKQSVMGANYMRQVPGVSGDTMSSFSFLGSDPKKQQDNKSFDFVKDAMKNEK